MPNSVAQRQQLYRERRKRGLRCLTVELRTSEIDELVRRGLLPASERHNLHSVRAALYRHFDRTLQALG